MAKDFNGTTSTINYTLNANQTSLDTISFGERFYSDSYATNYRKWWYQGTVGDREMAVEMDSGYGTPTGLVFVAKWSTQPGVWSCDAPATGSWASFIITYDWGSTSNDPIIYLGGASATVTERLAPIGTKDNNGTALNIGSEAASSNFFDGRAAEPFIYNRIITPTEAQRIGRDNMSPRTIPEGLVFYSTLNGGAGDIIGRALEVETNTSNIAHPPVNYLRRSFGINMRPRVFAPGIAR